MCFTIFTELFCCAGKTACDAGCCLCKSICETSYKQQIRIAYLSILIFCMFFIIFITDLGLVYITPWKSYLHCNKESGGDLICLGISAVYRMSFALFILFFIMLIFCLLRNEMSQTVNEGCWGFKLFILIGVFFLLFFIPNNFFHYYSIFCAFVGQIFLLFQIVMIIDLCYLWGEKWVDLYHRYSENYSYLLVGTAISLYVIFIVFNIYLFIWFYRDDECSSNKTIIIINIVVGILSTILTISGIARNGSLISSGSLCIYNCLILFNGLANSENKKCNYFYESHSPVNFEIFFGCILITISIFYVSMNNYYLKDNSLNQDTNNKIEICLEAKNIIVQDSEDQKIITIKKFDIYQESNIYIYFHIIMIASSCYLAMIFSNWAAPQISQQIIKVYEPNVESFWIHVISSWISYIIYNWTIIAPIILKNRDFD